MAHAGRWLWAVVGSACVGVALFAGVGAMAHPAGSHKTVSREQLPDLDQETPSRLVVRAGVAQGRRTYRLGFRSAVRNIGSGPLIVDGHRLDTKAATMTVDQVIDRVGEPQRVIADIGRMRYAVSPDHSHWHYVQFERYELRRSDPGHAASAAVVVTDRKSGFCLGDRYRGSATPLPAARPRPLYTSRCGLAEPDLLHMHEGISVGYGDDYAALLEGQDLSLDGLPDGRYVLVHRVNADRHLRELSYANDAASVLLDLRWQDGTPTVQVLAACADTDRCDGQGGAGTPALQVPGVTVPRG
jgi:Lysyl oxidase